jgi:DNA invertase Pin-like site-specific DNA recombinase
MSKPYFGAQTSIRKSSSSLKINRSSSRAHGKLVVTVLGGLAEFERHLILARTTEGRKRTQAMACGLVGSQS